MIYLKLRMNEKTYRKLKWKSRVKGMEDGQPMSEVPIELTDEIEDDLVLIIYGESIKEMWV